MTNAIEEGASPGVHPDEVARLFEVHPRTPFRWIRAGRLHSKNGRVNAEEVENSLPLWLTSSLLADARIRLKVSAGTMRSWITKGYLTSRMVLGFERITHESIERMEKRPKNLKMSGNISFDRRNRLLMSTGLSGPTINRQIEKGALEVVRENGEVLIPIAVIEKIEADWKRTCNLSETRRILQVSKEKVRRLLKDGQLEEVRVLGKRRVTLESISRSSGSQSRLAAHVASEERKLEGRKSYAFRSYHHIKDVGAEARSKAVAKLRSDLEKNQRQAGKSKVLNRRKKRKTWALKAKKLAKQQEKEKLKASANEKREKDRAVDKEALQKKRAELLVIKTKAKALSDQKKVEKSAARLLTARPPRWKPVVKVRVVLPTIPQNFVLEPVVVEGFETRRLTTLVEVDKVLSRGKDFVLRHVRLGNLRVLEHDDVIYPFISSAEMFIKRCREGAIK